jgi:hypothetical protein
VVLDWLVEEEEGDGLFIRGRRVRETAGEGTVSISREGHMEWCDWERSVKRSLCQAVRFFGGGM